MAAALSLLWGLEKKNREKRSLLIHISEIRKQLTMTRERSQSECLPYLHSPKNRTGRHASTPKQKGWSLCLFQRFLKFSALQSQCGKPFFSNTLHNLPSLSASPHSCHCTQSHQPSTLHASSLSYLPQPNCQVSIFSSLQPQLEFDLQRKVCPEVFPPTIPETYRERERQGLILFLCLTLCKILGCLKE